MENDVTLHVLFVEYVYNFNDDDDKNKDDENTLY